MYPVGSTGRMIREWQVASKFPYLDNVAVDTDTGQYPVVSAINWGFHYIYVHANAVSENVSGGHLATLFIVLL